MDKMGICSDCKEWTTVRESCCGAGVYVEGTLCTELDSEHVTVLWFDNTKGIGEGLSSEGHVVLSSECFSHKLMTLSSGDVVECDLEDVNGEVYASNIKHIQEYNEDNACDAFKDRQNEIYNDLKREGY